MKVALLSDCYLPRLGGIEVQVHDLAARLQGRGHDIVVFTATPGPGGERSGVVNAVDGVPVHRLTLRLPLGLPVNPWARPELRRRLVAGRFDVAHLHTGVVSPFAFDSARLLLGLGLPTTMTWHCVLARSERVFRSSGHVRRWAERGMAMNAVSEVAAAPLRRLVGDTAEVSVLPNGIDVGQWVPAPRNAPQEGSGGIGGIGAGNGSDGIRLVTAMRLASRKRPMPLLRLMAQVRVLVPASTDIQLDIIGDGPLRSRLERYVAGHGMSDWVHLLGRLPRSELRERYAASDVYLSPAVLESFGIAALEARTAGLPVVGRSGSGISEFVQDGVNGLLADGDEAMAGCIARLAIDTELTRRMAAHNREVGPDQSWEHVVELAEAEYARAITAMGSGGPS